MPRRKFLPEPEPKRRRRGSGSVSLRADGRWQAQVTRDGKRETTYHASRDEALAYLASLVLREQRLAELAALGRDESFGSYLARWLESKRQTIRIGTWRDYDMSVRHTEPLWSVRLADLRPDLFRDLFARLLKAEYQPSTVRKIRSHIKSALNDGVPDLWPANPVSRARLPRVETRVSAGQVLSEQEARRYLAAAAGTPYDIAAQLMLGLGLRLGETRGLRWSDIDWTAGTLTVARSLRTAAEIGPTKGGSPRTVVVPRALIASLRRHRDRQTVASVYVITGASGAPLGPETVRRMHHDCRERARITRRIRIHDLRHTAATLLLDNGVPVAMVAAMLGHASPTITMQVYAHVLESRRDRAAEAMQSLIFEPNRADPQSDTQSGSGNL